MVTRAEPDAVSPRPARILHTSDCHLDRLDNGPEQRAFEAVIDLSIALDVDLVLITGDLFDHNRMGADVVTWTAAQLARSDRPVVLLTGNHDALDRTSVYHRFDRSNCPRVRLIDEAAGQTIAVDGTDVTVWARAMVEHEPGYRPLQGAPARSPGRWHVVAGHGLAVHLLPGRSSPIPAEDLDGLDADYVALGHIHAFTVVRQHPLTVYPGTPPYSRKGEPGCVLVTLDPAQPPRADWLPLHLPAYGSP
jgi:exonuclease SbcD